MNLYDLLTNAELARIRKNDRIRNCDINHITVEELAILPIDSTTDERVITHGAYVLDELLFRVQLRTRPDTAALLPSNQA